MSAIDFEAEARAYLVWAGITFSKTDVTTLALRFGGIAERVATVVGIERDAARRALAAEQAAHADTERQLRDALARERAELAARVADVARLETSSRVMREEFDRMCEALQKHVGGEGLGGEWYPDLVATVVEEREIVYGANFVRHARTWTWPSLRPPPATTPPETRGATRNRRPHPIAVTGR